ncbi:hypothetical protein [Streptosporangium sp. NPDC002607]
MAESVGADDEGVPCGIDDFSGDSIEPVELHDALGLVQQAGDEPEVACGRAGDGGNGIGCGDVGDIQTQVGERGGKNGDQFADGESAVVVDEADAAVEGVPVVMKKFSTK